MRELKFRAWIKNYNCYADVLGFEQDRLFVQFQSGERAQHRLYVPIEDCVLEQYTGLKDKNGQKIYEGDIVTFMVERFNNVTLGFESEDWHTAVVEWNQDDACYSFMVRDVPFSVRYEAEVIGNIHKQPELLEANDVD